jgi:DNA-binding transcriptional ArsR family regulator
MAGSRGGRPRRNKNSHYRRAALEHPLRREILRLMLDGAEAGPAEIAAELDRAPGRISYHLLVLFRRDALKARARGRRAALYRLSPEAHWARKMLGEYDKRGRGSGREGGENGEQGT